MIIKKIKVLSAVKTFALLSAITGLFLGITFAFMSLSGYAIETETGSVPIDKTFGFLSIILFPVMYGIMGAISGFILSFFYNFVSSRVGGLDLEVE